MADIVGSGNIGQQLTRLTPDKRLLPLMLGELERTPHVLPTCPGALAAFAGSRADQLALIAERTRAGLAAARARGRMGGRPRKMDRATLIMAMAALSDPKAKAMEVAKRLGLTTTTLYAYVNGDGSPKAAGTALLNNTRFAVSGVLAPFFNDSDRSVCFA